MAWTSDSPQGAHYQRRYLAELKKTYVAYAGTGALEEVGDYVRIDGPSVWSDLACQPSRTAFPIHFHTLWRDRAGDYARVVQPAPWENRRARRSSAGLRQKILKSASQMFELRRRWV